METPETSESNKALSNKNHNQQFQKTHRNKTALDSNQFRNFPSFPAFRIGSIAQNENPETPEIFKSSKI